MKGAFTLTVISAANKAAADDTDEPAPLSVCVGDGNDTVGVLFVGGIITPVAL